MANKICHIEVVAKDLEKAKEFYSKLFGWGTELHDSNYMMFKDGEGGVGGAFFLPYENSVPVKFYIEVEDMEAKIKEVEAAGGEILYPKTLITEEYGYFSLFKDLSDNVIGLWSQK